MSQLAAALQRAGYEPTEIGAPRREAKARLLQDYELIREMSDEMLRIEALALDENMQAIRIDIAASETEPGFVHEPGWRRRAEHAYGAMKSRRALVQGETERRGAEAKAQRRAAANCWAEAFVQRARVMLPKDVFAMVLDATNAVMGETRS